MQILFHHPCRSVTLVADPITIVDMETTALRKDPEIALGPMMSHTPYSHLDCGSPLYTLTYTEEAIVDLFMTYSQVTGDITIFPQELAMVNNYSLQWTISYPDYQESTPEIQIFQIKILPCVVVSINPPTTPIDPIIFIVGSSQILIPFDDFV